MLKAVIKYNVVLNIQIIWIINHSLVCAIVRLIVTEIMSTAGYKTLKKGTWIIHDQCFVNFFLGQHQCSLIPGKENIIWYKKNFNKEWK